MSVASLDNQSRSILYNQDDRVYPKNLIARSKNSFVVGLNNQAKEASSQRMPYSYENHVYS